MKSRQTLNNNVAGSFLNVTPKTITRGDLKQYNQNRNGYPN